MGIERVRWVLGAAAGLLLVVLALVPSAQASFPSLYDGDIGCAPQPASGNVRLCAGETTTWDGVTQIDVNVVLPPEPGTGADGPYPLVGIFHGWGGSKLGLGDEQVQRFSQNGYAVFSMSDRGWGDSCGGSDPDRLSEPAACAAGYNHLLDTRYEVRDAQYLISVLADEGVAQPGRIGATGYSYGGGMSMALAALRNRTMLPDGSLVPWTSPEGTAMELAAAVPQWPWSDLAYSLMPNGTTLDYVADAPYLGPNGDAPIGVMKESYVSGLYALGSTLSNYAPPKADEDADLTTWYTLINAGEPYDVNPLAASLVEEITAHHSSYYIDHSQPPAPLLIQNGWNDDLFPVDEAIRFYNRTRTEFPGAPISLFLMDDGHARDQEEPADTALFREREYAWFDHYLKGAGPTPEPRVEALTTTCGGPSAGPYEAPTWKDLAPGEIRLDGAAAQTIAPVAGDPAIGVAFDPIATGDACATAPGADQLGAANYRLTVPDPGFTLLGSPTIVADLAATGGNSSLAARLLDVAPGGEETLVARGLLRPGDGGKGVVFQLHPQAYRFAPGHVVKLELLPSDAPYSRPSNLQAPIAVSNLQLRLPTLEQPGALGGLVQPPAPKVLPPGYEPARDYRQGSGGGPGGPAGTPRGKGVAGLAKGRMTVNPKGASVRLDCSGGENCEGRLTIRAGRRTVATGSYAVPAGTKRLTLRLTKAGRAIVGAAYRNEKRSFPVRLTLEDSGRPQPVELRRRLHLSRVPGLMPSS